MWRYFPCHGQARGEKIEKKLKHDGWKASRSFLFKVERSELYKYSTVQKSAGNASSKLSLLSMVLSVVSLFCYGISPSDLEDVCLCSFSELFNFGEI